MSLHEPIMPINAESNRKGGNAFILKKLYDLLKDYPFLNTQNLKKIIG